MAHDHDIFYVCLIKFPLPRSFQFSLQIGAPYPTWMWICKIFLCLIYLRGRHRKRVTNFPTCSSLSKCLLHPGLDRAEPGPWVLGAGTQVLELTPVASQSTQLEGNLNWKWMPILWLWPGQANPGCYGCLPSEVVIEGHCMSLPFT